MRFAKAAISLCLRTGITDSFSKCIMSLFFFFPITIMIKDKEYILFDKQMP